jgi:hypothetical protein
VPLPPLPTLPGVGQIRAAGSNAVHGFLGHFALVPDPSAHEYGLAAAGFVLMALPVGRRDFRWVFSVIACSFPFLWSCAAGVAGVSLTVLVRARGTGPARVAGGVAVWGAAFGWWCSGDLSFRHAAVVDAAAASLPVFAAAAVVAVAAGVRLVWLWSHAPEIDPTRFFSPEQREEILARYGNRCAGCGADGSAPGVELQMDHVVAHANGGPTDVSNGQPLCPICNKLKSDGTQADLERKLRERGITPYMLRPAPTY